MSWNFSESYHTMYGVDQFDPEEIYCDHCGDYINIVDGEECYSVEDEFYCSVECAEQKDWSEEHLALL